MSAAAAAIPIIGGIAGGVLQARAEKAAAAARARVQIERSFELEVQVPEILEAGRVASGMKLNEIRARRSSATAGAAGRGIAVGVGSAGVAESQIDALGRLDVLTVRYNAERAAQSVERQVAGIRRNAGEEIEVGNNLSTARAVQAGFGGAASALSHLSLGSGFHGFGEELARTNDRYGLGSTLSNANYGSVA